MAARHQVDIEVSRLPIQNSRGCWRGAVHHCVFCGIHDDDMAFRTLVPELVRRGAPYRITCEMKANFTAE